MQYTREQLAAAQVQDAIDRLALQQADLVHGRAWRPAYGDLEPSRAYEPVPVTAADVSPGELDDAVSELAQLNGVSYADMWDEVLLTSEGERDTVSLTNAVVELAQLGTSKRNDLPDEAFAWSEPGGEKDEEGKTVPRSLRHFPIHDRAHVANALARIGQGAEFGKQALPKVKAAARKLGVEYEGGEEEEGEENENQRSRRSRRAPQRPSGGGGWGSNEAPEGPTGTGEGGPVAAARRWARTLGTGTVSLSAWDDDEVELAQPESGGGPVDELARKYPEYFGQGGKKGQRSETRVEDEEPRDRRQPHRGGQVHPEVFRYLRELHSGGFGGREAPSGSVVTHRRAGWRRSGRGKGPAPHWDGAGLTLRALDKFGQRFGGLCLELRNAPRAPQCPATRCEGYDQTCQPGSACSSSSLIRSRSFAIPD
jgi:hypothetical protein